MAHPSPGPTYPPTGWASAAGLVPLAPLRRPIGPDDLLGWVAVHDAFARWSVALDEGLPEVLRSLFTAEAEFVVTHPDGTVRTRQVGGAAVAERIVSLHAQQRDQRRHNIATVVVDPLAADAAEAVAYGTVTRSADGYALVGSVLYSASLRRGDDGIWRFTRLHVGLDG